MAVGTGEGGGVGSLVDAGGATVGEGVLVGAIEEVGVTAWEVVSPQAVIRSTNDKQVKILNLVRIIPPLP